MDNKLKNTLIIIGVLLAIYFWISPFRSCVREYTETHNQYCENWKKYPEVYSSKSDCRNQWKLPSKTECAKLFSW